jgi:hypothetical protein
MAKNKIEEFEQLSLPLYLGESIPMMKKKVRNSEARNHFEQIEKSFQSLVLMVDLGAVRSSDARIYIRNCSRMLGIK